MSKADYLPRCGWASSDQLKTLKAKTGFLEKKEFCLKLPLNSKSHACSAEPGLASFRPPSQLPNRKTSLVRARRIMRTGADTRRLRFGRDAMGAGLVCLTHMRSWPSPVLSMGERKDSVLSLIFHPFPPGRCIRGSSRPAPSRGSDVPQHPPWHGRLPLAGRPAGHTAADPRPHGCCGCTGAKWRSH